jgi:hypothetical protein
LRCLDGLSRLPDRVVGRPAHDDELGRPLVPLSV